MRKLWTSFFSALLVFGALSVDSRPAGADDHGRGHAKDHSHKARTLYIWAGDQARVAPDFLAVIDFDEHSDDYGKVIKTVPVPPPGNVGNEPHHCHLSADKNILACGGLLSLLRGQNGIFFFDVSEDRDPKFLFSTSAPLSSITDDFYPLPEGGFLVTQMGSATGGAPGRVAEFDRHLRLVKEWPDAPPQDGFNPHGISVRPELNLMVTSDFINPVSTLNVVPGDPELRGAIRVWDLQQRTIVRTIEIPDGHRHHGRQAHSGRSAGPRLHGRNVRWPGVPGRYRRGHGHGRLRLRRHRSPHRCSGPRGHDADPRHAGERGPADLRFVPGRAGRHAGRYRTPRIPYRAPSSISASAPVRTTWS